MNDIPVGKRKNGGNNQAQAKNPKSAFHGHTPVWYWQSQYLLACF
jgi:hypothetical protein